MTVRADVAELLRAGHGDRTIARRLGVTTTSVTAARAALGLPKARGGFKPAASVEDLYWRRVQPTPDGHLEWDGHRNHKGTPTIHWQRKGYSALRVAYRIRTGTYPTGYTHTTCEHPGCVHPDHVADSAVIARKAHHHSAAGRQPNGSREDVVALLRAGHSDKQVGKQLRTNPKRVARIRAEEGLPAFESRALTFAERWPACTEPTGDGHVRWTGPLHHGASPAVFHEGRYVSVRQLAFERLHGRPAVGRVKPGCGRPDCVRPDHLEDRPMRDALTTQMTAIFGSAA